MPEPKTQTSWIALLVIAIIAFGILLAIRPSPNQGLNPTGIEDAELLISQTLDSASPAKTKTAKAPVAPASKTAPKLTVVHTAPPIPAATARTAWAGGVHHENP